MRRGSTLIGWGMAGGAWESMQQKAAAGARLTVDGKLTVSSATEDIRLGSPHGGNFGGGRLPAVADVPAVEVDQHAGQPP